MTARIVFAVVLLALASGRASFAQTITPEPIALGPSDFPLPTDLLERQIAANDTAALRQHAWKIWTGMIADSTQSFQGQKLPIWETWLSEQEAFAGATLALSNGPRTLLPFSRPSQFRHQVQNGAQPSLQAAANAEGPPLFAVVKFSPDQAGFVEAQHATPPAGGPTVSYTRTADLNRLNAYFDQQGTATAARKIVDFPVKAIGLKAILYPVKGDRLTAIPLWGGPQDSTDPDHPRLDTWNQCIAVDASNTQSGTTDIDCFGKTVKAAIVPRSSFYSRLLDAAGAEQASKALGLSGAASLVAGDYVVLVGMHITTKEIPNWTWQTLWWQNGRSQIPGSVDGMPDETKVKGFWRNYAMCTADSMVVPSTDPKGKPTLCYNPYLETALPDGIHSNCMSCHARASFPGVPYPETYIPNGWIDFSDPIFAKQTQTDFVWAIQNSAR
jgi:hypothetical protein